MEKVSSSSSTRSTNSNTGNVNKEWIQIKFEADPRNGTPFPQEYKKYFDEAKTIWQQVILGVQNRPNHNLVIHANVLPIDGRGGILGQAGPERYLEHDKYFIPVEGVMQFDIHDVEDMVREGTFHGVILHEMCHVFGVGSLWHLYTKNFARNERKKDPRWYGALAVKEYQKLLDQLEGNTKKAKYVPLENVGGDGTFASHWRESEFDEEIMTGFADLHMPISRLTIANLEELGYNVDYNRAEEYAIQLKTLFSMIRHHKAVLRCRLPECTPVTSTTSSTS